MKSGKQSKILIRMLWILLILAACVTILLLFAGMPRERQIQNTKEPRYFITQKTDAPEILTTGSEAAERETNGSIPEPVSAVPLQASQPDALVNWNGESLKPDTEEMSLTGKAVTKADVDALMKLLPGLKMLDVRDCGLTDAQRMTLAETYPDCFFLWDMTVAGETFSTASEEIDLSGHAFTIDAIERLLLCFPKLTRVIMCNCGLSDEEMDSLNRSHEGIRFVWSVKIRNVELRTDAKYFYPYKFYPEMVVGEEDLYPLRYCVDLEAIDIGHMTTVKTCDWLAYMPNMKYLILVETAITDISPLANLKNLVFLEIFTTKITDYSPLLECTALEDLNLGNTYGDPEPILKMTWLKNLWWSGIEGTYGLPCSDAPQRLREALPDTRMKFNLSNPNVENGWRQLDNYYAMRDLMDVFYLA